MKLNNKLQARRPLLILVIGIVLSFLIWQLALQQKKREHEAKFESLSQDIVDAVKERLEIYIDAQYGGVGLFVASKNVTQEEWGRYTEALHIRKRYPGINGIGYAAYVKDSDKESFEERQSKARNIQFNIFPLGTRSDYMPVVYLEPLILNRTAIAFDMGSEAKRRTALERSRAENKPYLSGKIILVQDEQKTPGFLSYIPIYSDEARLSEDRGSSRNFLGWIYAPFIARDFFQGLEELELRQVKDLIVLNVYNSHDLSKEDLLYSNGKEKSNLPLNFIRHVQLYGQEWTFQMKPTIEFERTIQNDSSILILLLGLLISFFLFYVVRNISITGAKAEILAKQMTLELRRKTQDLERSNAELEQFAYIASHDLQEPIRTVASYTSLLHKTLIKQNLFDEKTEQYFDYISTAVVRMRTLITDLLSFARISQDVQLQAVASSELVQQSLDNLSVAIKEANIDIEVAKDLPQVFGDANKLRQLFQNLVSNAINYRDTAKAIAKIKISYTDYDNEYYKFIVEDNGIGIAKEYYEKVFIIFQRLEEKPCPGTGIGLALCKKIINYHGGEIWIDSELGQYCRFCFTLPKLS